MEPYSLCLLRRTPGDQANGSSRLSSSSVVSSRLADCRACYLRRSGADREPADGAGPDFARHYVVLVEGDPAHAQVRDRFAEQIPGHQVPDPKLSS